MDTPELIRVLKTKGKLYKRSKGQVINTSLYANQFNLIQSGYVKRYLIRKDGSLSVQSIYGPNHFFPINSVFSRLFNYTIENINEYYYEAMTTVAIYSMTMNDLDKIINRWPSSELYRDLLSISARRLEFHTSHLANDALGSAYYKVAHELVFLAKLFARKTSKGYELLLPLRHQDLADLLNLTRETVSKEMGKLQNKGLIHHSQTILIPSLTKLAGVYS